MWGFWLSIHQDRDYLFLGELFAAWSLPCSAVNPSLCVRIDRGWLILDNATLPLWRTATPTKAPSKPTAFLYGWGHDSGYSLSSLRAGNKSQVTVQPPAHCISCLRPLDMFEMRVALIWSCPQSSCPLKSDAHYQTNCSTPQSPVPGCKEQFHVLWTELKLCWYVLIHVLW